MRNNFNGNSDKKEHLSHRLDGKVKGISYKEREKQICFRAKHKNLINSFRLHRACSQDQFIIKFLILAKLNAYSNENSISKQNRWRFNWRPATFLAFKFIRFIKTWIHWSVRKTSTTQFIESHASHIIRDIIEPYSLCRQQTKENYCILCI